jgi:hypothetical protein
MPQQREQPLPIDERKHLHEVKTGFLTAAIGFLGLCVTGIGIYATSEANRRANEQQAAFQQNAAEERRIQADAQHRNERFTLQSGAIQNLHLAMGKYQSSRADFFAAYWQFVSWSAVYAVEQENGIFESADDLKSASDNLTRTQSRRLEAAYDLDHKALACIIIFGLDMTVDETFYKSASIVPTEIVTKHLTMVKGVIAPILKASIKKAEKQNPSIDLVTRLIPVAEKTQPKVLNDLIQLDAKTEEQCSRIFKSCWESLATERIQTDDSKQQTVRSKDPT